KLFPAGAGQANVGSMGPRSQDSAAARIPTKEKHVICLRGIGGTPERFMRGVKAEQFADTLISLNFLISWRVFRPANRPGRSCDRVALVHSIPGFHADLDRDEPDEQ